jgi:hypothetical protein
VLTSRPHRQVRADLDSPLTVVLCTADDPPTPAGNARRIVTGAEVVTLVSPAEVVRLAVARQLLCRDCDHVPAVDPVVLVERSRHAGDPDADVASHCLRTKPARSGPVPASRKTAQLADCEADTGGRRRMRLHR